MGRYLDIARRKKSPVSVAVDTWLCRYCDSPVKIEEVCASRDGLRRLTLWHCGSCQTHGCTPDGISIGSPLALPQQGEVPF